MKNSSIPDHLTGLAGSLKDFNPEVVRQHLTRLDHEYFLEFDKQAIGRHLSLIAGIDGNNACRVCLSLETNDKFSFTIAGKDVQGALAVIAGVLTAAGFDIDQGRIFTYSRLGDGREKSPPASYFIDKLKGTCPENSLADAALQDKLESQINQLLLLLLSGDRRKAQKRLYKKFGDYLTRKARADRETHLLPIQIVTRTEEPFTVLNITGQSVPGFLFSLANAMTLQGMVLHKLIIETANQQVNDTIYVTDRYNRPVLEKEKIDKLTTIVALIKQFTFLLPEAPDYDMALRQFDSLLERMAGGRFNILSLFDLEDKSLLSAMAKAFGSGEYFWEEFIKLQSDTFLPILRQLDKLKLPKSQYVMHSELTDIISNAETFEEKVEALNQYKNRELFRIDLLYLVYPNKTFADFGRELSSLAEITVNTGVHLIREKLIQRFGPPRTERGQCRFAVMALGKFGGGELGYASDLEIAVIYEAAGANLPAAGNISRLEFFNRLTRELKKAIPTKRAGIFELDLRLRPHGEDGELSCSLDYWKKYYAVGGKAHDYERQALIKLRPIYGDTAFTSAIMRSRDKILYGRLRVGIDKTLTLREKQYRELVQGGETNVKYSQGGLCEIEYGIQFLQLRYGARFPQLRVANTISAMERLLDLGLITPSEFEKLYNHYAFHRRLINALRMVRGNARDLILPKTGREEFHFLSKRLGYLPKGGASPDDRLEADLKTVFEEVHQFFKTRFIDFSGAPFGKPGLPELLMGDRMEREDINRIAESLGVGQSKPTRRILLEMAERSPDKKALMTVMVMAQRFIRRSPSPDKVIINLQRYFEAEEVNATMLKQMTSHPQYLEILILVLGYGDFLSGIIIRYPYFIYYIANHSSLSYEKNVDAYSRETEAMGKGKALEQQTEELKIFFQREILRIGIRDMYLSESLNSITRELSNLSDAVVRTIYGRLARQLGNSNIAEKQCIIVLGKLGGRELNYSSDIDLVFVTDDRLDETEFNILEKLNRRLINLLIKNSINGKFFRVDSNLRPYGAQGSLTATHSSCRRYYSEKAGGWELQAWLKARPLAGNTEKGLALISWIQTLALKPCKVQEITENMRLIRFKTLKAIPLLHRSREIKSGPGGIRTVEFFVQHLQIQWGRLFPAILSGNTLQALEKLRMADLIAPDDYLLLQKGYTLLRKIEHSIQLEGMQQRHLLPSSERALNGLARRLGFEDRLRQSAQSQLLEQFEPVSSGLASLSERVFPGSGVFYETYRPQKPDPS